MPRPSLRKPGRLSAVVVLLTLLPHPLTPAVITVEGDCLLVQAIQAANNDNPVGGCTAGSGDDTLVLTSDHTFPAPFSSSQNALPLITSTITIDGRNHVLERDLGAATEFRIAQVDETGVLTIDRATISNGRQIVGGAFLVEGTLSLRNSTVSFNNADADGGAARIEPGGYLEAYRTTFYSNSVTGYQGIAHGGAIDNRGTLSALESTFEANRAGTSPFFVGSPQGGAIRNWAGGSASVQRTTLSGNRLPFGSPGQGSTVYNLGSFSAENSTISGNGVANPPIVAAAIYNAAGTTSLVETTLSGNHDHALENASGSLSVRDSIIANTSGGPNCAGSITNLGNNLADDDSCSLVPETLTGLDPALADNGGPTKTHELEPGSNAIDSPTQCFWPFDQRAATNVGNCDIGAYEYLGCPVIFLLEDIIATTETYEGCAIRAGLLAKVVGPDGHLTLRFGKSVMISDDFSVEEGATLVIERDPALNLIFPELIEADRARRRALVSRERPPD